MNDALIAIASIEAQIHAMGANDSEHGDLAQIRARLEAGELSPGEAIIRAEGARDGKQSDH